MPYTPTAPILVLCENLITDLVAAWEPKSPSGAEWQFWKRIVDEGSTSVLCDPLKLEPDERRVILIPADYDTAYETRAEDAHTHEIDAVVVERYTEAGDPPRDWVAERVDFVFTYIAEGFDFRSPPIWNRKLRTMSSDIEVLDLERLLTGGHLFYSTVKVTFQEIRDA